jgi:hypothetical protein
VSRSLEIRKGLSGGRFATEMNMKKARDSFINFPHFKRDFGVFSLKPNE